MVTTEETFESKADDIRNAFHKKLEEAVECMEQEVNDNGAFVLAECKALKSKNKKLRREKRELMLEMEKVEEKRAEAEKERDEAEALRLKSEKAKEEAEKERDEAKKMREASLNSFKLLQEKRNEELAQISEMRGKLLGLFRDSRKRRRQANASDGKEERVKISAILKAYVPKKRKLAINNEQNIACCVGSKTLAEKAAAAASERLADAKSQLRKLLNKASSSSSSSSSGEEDAAPKDVEDLITEAKERVKWEEESLEWHKRDIEGWERNIKLAQEHQEDVDWTDACTSSSFSVSSVGADDDEGSSSSDVDSGSLRAPSVAESSP
jgi:hypothetical protein